MDSIFVKPKQSKLSMLKLEYLIREKKIKTKKVSKLKLVSQLQM